jgi:hypothetical protein
MPISRPACPASGPRETSHAGLIRTQASPSGAVPFFWSAHYDVTFNYVGHAQTWDSIEADGSLAERNCTLRYKQGGRTMAVLTVGRDAENLRLEAELESA